MKRLACLSIVAAVVVFAAPAGAQYYSPDNGIRIRAGLFTPNAEGEYFDQVFRDFTGDPEDFEDGTLGVEYIRSLGPAVDLLIGGSFFETTQPQAYRDFEDAEGFSIVHDTILESSNLEVGLRVKLAPRHSPVVPYVGAGGTAIHWQLTEQGDFIDFNPPPAEIFTDTFEAEGTTVGYFLVAGLDIPIGRDFAVFVEGRWREAEDDLSDDFEDFGKLDLSGREITGGVTWRF